MPEPTDMFEVELLTDGGNAGCPWWSGRSGRLKEGDHVLIEDLYQAFKKRMDKDRMEEAMGLWR